MSEDGKGEAEDDKGPKLHDPRSHTSETPADEANGEGGQDEKADDDEAEEKKPNKAQQALKNPLVRIGLVVALVVLLIALILFSLHARKFQSTDDAFVDTHIVHLAPQLAGRVTGVYADDNALVGTNQLLVQIDPVDADTRVAQARAQRAQAVAQRDQAAAQRVQALAQIETQTQSARQAAAQVPGVEAQAAASAKDLARYVELKRTNPLAVAGSQLDNARAQAEQTASQAQAQRKARDAALAQVKQAETQVAGADAQIRGAEAQIGAADAQLASANTNRGYAELRAPLIGHVARKNVAIGSYVQPGQELMAIVPTQLWITANFKETQLKNMRVGQRAEIKIDAYPDVKFRGHIQSIQRGAGQAFAVLPSENATGNFVKVVQRVPVKIVIENLDDLHHPLGPGMSAKPKIRVLE